MSRTAIIRRATFNAAHRLHNENWSDAENKRVFGKCNNPNFHGHNYVLEVKVIGDINPETGYVIDAKILKKLIELKVTERYDHKNLNLDVTDFKRIIPTAENIAKLIYDNLRVSIDTDKDLKIKLYETENNIVEYPA